MAALRERRNVLIVGASTGIGRAAADRLVSDGERVLGTSRRPQANVPAEGIEWLVMDVCDEASVRRGMEAAIERAGHLDAVICCAGYGIFGSVEDVSIEAAQAQFETNYFGTLRILRAVLPHMREHRRGHLLIVGSLGGRAPIPFQSHYSASKAALDATVMALRNEVGAFGVQVVLIEPGDINTPFNDAMNWDTSPQDSPYRQALAKCEQVIRTSLPKAPGPELVARAISKALSTANPRVRYTVGREAVEVPFGRRFLPDRVMLRFIAQHFGLR